MRDNDLLDGAWDQEEIPAPKPVFHRKNAMLDKMMGVGASDDVFEECFDAPKPKKERKRRTVVCKTSPKKQVKRTKRKKFTKVSPGEAIDLLAAWEKKLLKARAMVQKYRQAVKRYTKQGKIRA